LESRLIEEGVTLCCVSLPYPTNRPSSFGLPHTSFTLRHFNLYTVH
jgi:hypothetical protein